MEKLTLEILLDKSKELDVYKTIEFAKSFYIESLPKVPKPFLKTTDSLNTEKDVDDFIVKAKKYVNELENYKVQNPFYLKSKEKSQEHNREVDSIIEFFIKEESGFNNIPDSSKKKVWEKASEDGSSYGFYEIFVKLESLCELF